MSGRTGANTGGIICCTLIGVCLLTGGSLVLVSHSKDSCPCGSKLCCALDKGCPHHAPCLCVSADINAANNTCSPKDKGSESGRVTAWAWTIIGAGLSSPLALYIMYRLYKVLRSTMYMFRYVFWVIVQTLGDRAKRLYTKVTSLWAYKQTVPVEFSDTASVELAPLEFEA